MLGMNSHSLDELLLIQSSGKISLIAQNQNLSKYGHFNEQIATWRQYKSTKYDLNT